MPQMGPLLWFNLMIMFLGGCLVFFMSMYFFKLPSDVEEGHFKKMTCQKIWKW